MTTQAERSPDLLEEVDELEEIDDPTELLSKPLEPLPLVPPAPSQQHAPSQASAINLSPIAESQKKRQLPPGFGATSAQSRSAASSSSRPTIWNPPKTSTQAFASPAPRSSDAATNGLIIGGSGARVPTQFLDQNGGFTRQPPHQASDTVPVASPASSESSFASNIPGAFPRGNASLATATAEQPIKASKLSAPGTAIDLTLDSDEDDDAGKAATATHSNGTGATHSRLTLPRGSSSALASSNFQSAAPPISSSQPQPQNIVPIDDDDDDDEPVIVSLTRSAEQEFEIDHVRSNAIVCAGVISSVVLCMHGLPPALTYQGSIAEEPPEDPAYSRANWPGVSRWWSEKGYRPVMLTLPNRSQPSGTDLNQSSRSLPGGWTYNSMPPVRPDINVSVLVPPRVRYPHLPPDQADALGIHLEPAFGSLAEKYVTAMEPLMRLNRVRCEARMRMVPIGRAQNFLHYLEILVFVRRPDLQVLSDRLAHSAVQLEHPSNYFSEDYPTQPQYVNPHNPPAGGLRNDPMSRGYDGVYRGNAMGTSVQNREMTEKEKKAQVDAVYSSIRSGEELAAVEPVEIISTPLLQHQKQALGFLLNRERDRRWPELLVERHEEQDQATSSSNAGPKPKPESVKAESESHGNDTGKDKGKAREKAEADAEAERNSISLWTVRKGLNGKVRAWRNMITNREQFAQPRICRGSILADDMGLGKTITTLALIAHTLREAKAFGASEVQRDARADLWEAMRLITNFDDTVNGAKTGSKAGSRARAKLRIGTPDDDDDDVAIQKVDEDDDEDDDDSTPSFSLAMHNAPPTAKANGKSPKKKKDKIDPEVVRRKHLERRSRATLIVCPLSVVSNWEEQIKEHWKRRKRPTVYIYHGPQRATSLNWIANHDIVLTTYSTLGSEFSNQKTWVAEDTRTDAQKRSKRGGRSGSSDLDSEDDHGHDDDDDDDVFMVNEDGQPIENQTDKHGKNVKKRKRKPAKEAYNPLQRIEWFRVVLDEAHQIKGSNTWQSKAACNLSAQRRLCLTGTPIQNSINDLFALVKFLRLDPFTDRATWNEYCGFRENIKLRSNGKDDQPIEAANLGHVQILMKFLALRRQKTTKTAEGKQLLTLPPKYSKTEYLEFEEAEKARYQALHNLYKEDFEEMMANDTVGTNYATILHEILNLRMTCDHPSLVDASKDAKRRAGADLSEAIKQDGLSRERAAILFVLFRDSEMAYCHDCQVDLGASADRDAASNDADELADALDAAASDSRNGARSAKRTKIQAGRSPASEMMSATTSTNGFETPARNVVRPVVTRCQHLFCSPCFRRLIGVPWPNVAAEEVAHCPACRHPLKLLIDAIELEPSDFVGLNDDQADRAVDGDRDFFEDGVGAEGKSKGKEEADDDFDWGSGDEDFESKAPRRKAPRKNANGQESSTLVRGDLSLEGRKDLSTKIRALISDLIPFSKCNPHSTLYDPTAPRLVHVDPSTSEDPNVRKEEAPVVVIQRPPPAFTSNGLLGKLDHTMDALDSYEPVKSVVFSQWTKMLDRIQKSLSITGIRTTRLDGSMKRTDRTAALEAFRTDPSIEVLLVSLRAGGTGLNLVSACRAYLMDPYWNPAVENQGLDRVHRMGQTRPVITTKYVMKHSIEENLLSLQKRKMKLAEQASSKRQIGGTAGQSKQKEGVRDLKHLFGMATGDDYV